MSGMDEWQAIQNEKIRLMENIETGIAEKNAEIARLRKALKPFADINEFSPIGDGEIDRVYIEVSISDINEAHQALTASTTPPTAGFNI